MNPTITRILVAVRPRVASGVHAADTNQTRSCSMWDRNRKSLRWLRTSGLSEGCERQGGEPPVALGTGRLAPSRSHCNAHIPRLPPQAAVPVQASAPSRLQRAGGPVSAEQAVSHQRDRGAAVECCSRSRIGYTKPVFWGWPFRWIRPSQGRPDDPVSARFLGHGRRVRRDSGVPKTPPLTTFWRFELRDELLGLRCPGNRSTAAERHGVPRKERFLTRPRLRRFDASVDVTEALKPSHLTPRGAHVGALPRTFIIANSEEGKRGQWSEVWHSRSLVNLARGKERQERGREGMSVAIKLLTGNLQMWNG